MISSIDADRLTRSSKNGLASSMERHMSCVAYNTTIGIPGPSQHRKSSRRNNHDVFVQCIPAKREDEINGKKEEETPKGKTTRFYWGSNPGYSEAKDGLQNRMS